MITKCYHVAFCGVLAFVYSDFCETELMDLTSKNVILYFLDTKNSYRIVFPPKDPALKKEYYKVGNFFIFFFFPHTEIFSNRQFSLRIFLRFSPKCIFLFFILTIF